MRRAEKRDQEITDLHSVRIKEARWLMGICTRHWLQLWEEVYQFKVLHWHSKTGVRVNVDSLLVAVYPFIAKNTYPLKSP